MGREKNYSKKELKNTDEKNRVNTRYMKILPESTVLAVAMLAVGFAEVIFLAFVLALDVLPFKYLALGIFLLLAIDFLIVFLATSMSKHGTRRIGCLVVIFVMLITLLGGDYYIYSTNDTLNRISSQRDTWEYYYLLVNAESNYENVGDIEGKTVFVTDMDSKQLKEAKERLVTKADVEYIKEPNFVAVGEHLLNRDVKAEEVDAVKDAAESSKEVNKSEITATEVNDSNTLADTDVDITAEDADSEELNADAKEAIALVSESQYEILKSSINGFKKETKSIYQIKVIKRANDNSKDVNVTEDSFNILLAGIDCWGRKNKEGLSDVNMVLTVNPVNRSLLLTSIPRDSYLTLHSFGAKDKLTHSGIYGDEETKATIEDLLGIEINYSVRVNFSALVGLVNAVDGIRVYSDYDFKSSISHWTYQKGWNDLTGHSALYFARERKSFSEGDMQRNVHQQKILAATFKKITSSKVMLTRYTKILNAIEQDISTNMSQREMKQLVRMQLKDMRKWTINRVNIVGPTGGAPCYSMGGRNLSCVFPTEESINEVREAIHDVMYPAKIKNSKEDSNNSNQSEDKSE